MRASALFATICGTSDVREAWLGLATARRRLGDAAGAAEALATALRRHVPDPGFAALADAHRARRRSAGLVRRVGRRCVHYAGDVWGFGG